LDLRAELSGNPVRVGIAWVRDDAIPDGVIVSQVVAESPADRAGLRAGDVISRLAGELIGDDDAFRRRLLSDRSPLQFQVERNGRMIELVVPLYDPATKP
jgi:S1-C subfamily serine protease